MDTSIELIFITSTATGHIVSAVEMAKLLISRESRFSITVLLLKHPFDRNPTTAGSLSSSLASERINFVDLPSDEPPHGMTPISFFTTFNETQKPHVRDAVEKISCGGSVRVAGFVLDMFCTPMIDVANEFGVPSYVFFTSGAGLVCMMAHLISHNDAEIEDGLVVPSFTRPIPHKVFPFDPMDKESRSFFLSISTGIARSNGILVNTLEELEPGAIEALSSLDIAKFPPIYPVGPLINLNAGESGGEIREWLDGQPASSVVFLCFGSMGSFEADQVREIAIALERSGVRFLWSLRRPGEKSEKQRSPTEYESPAEVLPEGFLERTAGIGKVVGWAPQVAVLGHVAVGGFVSHCGWNSVLESVWFGVPLGTWPLRAEQHLNAFTLVTEFGLAVEIAIEDRIDPLVVDSDEKSSVVKAEKIERGIATLMDREGDVRKKVNDMSEKSKKALLHGGSSDASLSRFIINVIDFTLA